MASDLSSGSTEMIEILDDEKEEGEISLEDVSSSDEGGGISHFTNSYAVGRTRTCPDCKWGQCSSWCNMMYHSKMQNRRDPVKGKENRLYIKEAEYIRTKHAASTLQRKNDLVPVSSDSDMEIVGLADTSNRSKEGVKKKKRKKVKSLFTLDDLINTSLGSSGVEFRPAKTYYKERSSVHRRSRADREQDDSRSRIISRSPVRRHKSPVRNRSPIRSSRSPYNRYTHSKSPIYRSPQRIRSPKRSSPHRSSPLKTARRSSKQDSSLSARSHTDKRYDVTRLLKKVKLELNVNRKKENHSSLKEKLSNMLNKTAFNSSKNATDSKEKSEAQSEIIDIDVDDEDDLALLRQKALDTKQKKCNKSSDHPADAELEKTSDAKNDDQDEEALNLRMIALQSAFVKKHKNRVQRGVKASKKITRSESPFSQSFLDDIPVPSEELLKFASPPCTPSCTPPPDSNHAEDMDLDTDVEREKEKLPYSPTDKITSSVPVDTELLGIEPSDVSFINVNETNNIVFDGTVKQTDSISLSVAAPYYDNFHQYGELPQLYAYPSSQHSNETFLSDLSHNESTELVSHVSRDSHNIVCDLMDGISYSQEGRYSSTGVIHMPDASHTLPVIKDNAVASISPSGIYVSPKVQQIEQSVGNPLFMNSGPTYTDDRCTYDTQTIHGYVADSTATFISGYSEPMSLNEPIIPTSVLPDIETSQFASPIEEAVSCQATEEGTFQEPLYMQGLPDVTKDANKIPTLINRTLVPVPLLKSNKQLQQLLSTMKKRETHLEPTFKSAEMQPVIVTANAIVISGSNFKPIKLQSVKKPPPVLTTSVPFDNFVNEIEENDASEDKESFAPTNNQETTELGHFYTAATLAASSDDDASIRKKRDRGRSGTREFRKRVRKKCRSLDIAESTNNVNKDVNIRSASLEREIVADRSNCNGMHESIENGESSILQNVVSTQEPLLLNNIIKSKDRNDVERNDVRNEEEPKLAMSVIEEKNVKSDTLTNSASNNLNSRAFNADEITEDVDRRQSVEEDEDELRAILLASLKRTKSDNVCSISAAPVVVTSCTSTNTQAPVQQKRSTNLTTTVNTTCTESNNVPLSLKLTSLSETAAKKVNSISISSLTGNRKRSSNIAAVKAPLKKIPKKTPIPASTKAVNNAKKYQNMVQRKLNLLKLNNAKANVTALKTTLHASGTQRFVISLGSDTDSDSEGEKRKATSVIDRSEKQQAQDTIGVDFEKSLQKFLRDMRKEQEQSSSVVKPVSSPQKSKLTTQTMNKSSSNMHTPLAVRHLPASQQEEYRRLKQQILEREKLKQQKKIADNSNNNNNNNNNDNNKLLNTNKAGPSLVSSCENKNVTQNQVKLKEKSEKDSQQSTEIRKKNVTVVPKNTPASNASCMPVGENLSANIVKHTNTTQLPAKGIKKTILNDLSIRITNEVTPNHIVDRKTVENLDEKQSASDKQQHRPALRTLTKDEINRKYVKVQLKSDTNGRIVTINDKPASRHDTASISESNKSVESHNLSVEIVEEKIKNIEDNSNGSILSNASTVRLVNASLSKQETDDTLETTMSSSQYEAMRQREIANNISGPSTLSNNNNNASHQSDTNANDKGNTDDVWKVLKKDVKAELGNLMNLSRTDQEQYLKNTEHKLVTRRYNVLDYLAEMSGNLRQWDMEKDLQNCLTIEVKKLKEQLKIAEERLQMQRDRVNGMGPKVSTAREKINTGRHECFKLSRICSALGNRLLGKDYKLPEAGGQLLSEKLKEVANHTRQFTKKKRIQFSGNFENSSSSSNFCSSLPQQKSSNSESATVTSVEEDLSLPEQTVSATDTTDVMGSKSHTSRSKANESESLTMSELSLDPPQTFPSHTTPVKKKENSTNASELFSDEQSTPNQDALHSAPKQSSTPIIENSEVHRQKDSSTNISDPATSLELLGSSDPSCQADEQNNKKTSPQLPSLTATTTTMTTTTMTTTTTTTTIAPYVSMLTHLKMSRNTNPHGILCPYEIMGICRDEDCQYIHQSRNQT